MGPARGGQFAGEALDELVKCLTFPKYKDKLAVIMAGYEDEMEAMLQHNPGLHSRFPGRVTFHNLSPEATLHMFLTKLERETELSPQLETIPRQDLLPLAAALVGTTNFGNGRDVESWINNTISALANDDGGTADGVQLRHVEGGLQQLLSTRQSRKIVHEPTTVGLQQRAPAAAAASQSFRPPATRTAQRRAAEAPQEDEQEAPAPPADEHAEENPYDALNKAFLQTLQDIMTDMGYNSAEGVAQLQTSPEARLREQLATPLAQKLSISIDEAMQMINDWKNAGATMEELRKKAEKKARSKKQVPIWRCAVCGRADQPFIACYVAPYIVGYRAIGM
eukprot:m.19854 g.19854  ORF g.19854 m.19854 type:complete len:337 (+) comp8558_c0_seq1:134-1144(+)